MGIDYNAKWATIKTCIMNAEQQAVEQADMSAFLKRVFDTAINALRDLVEAGINLSDKDVVARLQELILAICQIPQHRIHAFNVSDVIKEFEVYEEHFYGYLSLPPQDAETSIACDWIVDRLDDLAEEPKVIDTRRLKTYLEICEMLAENGSDKIRAYLVDASENLANELTSEWMQEEAKMVWSFVVKLLSQDNVRIIQREKRLLIAQTAIEYF